MRKTFCATIVVAIGGMFAVGCAPSGEPAPSPEPTNPTPPLYEGEPLPDLELTEVEVADDIDIAEASAAWRFDDMIVVSGGDGEGYSAAAAIDEATGKVLWHTSDEGFDDVVPQGEGTTLFSPGNDLFGVPEHDLVVAETYTNPCPGDAGLCHESQAEMTKGFGMVGLDARDRSVAWRNDLLPPVERDDPAAASSQDAGLATTAYAGDVIVVAVGDSRATLEEEPVGMTFDAVGLEAATGEELWRIPQAVARVVTDEYLLTRTVEEGQDPLLEIRDPRTGDVRGAVEGIDGRWIAASGDLGLLAVPHPDSGTRTAARLVDLETGDVVGDELEAWGEDGDALVSFDDVMLGVQDGRAYAAWPSGGGHVMETGESRWVLNSQLADGVAREEGETLLPGQSFAQRADGGYVWLKTATDASGYALAAYDRTGEARTDPISVENGFVYEGVVVAQQAVAGDNRRNIRLWTYDVP